MCFASLCGYERSKWVYPHWQSVYFVRPCPSVTGENDSGFAGADIIVLGKCIGHFELHTSESLHAGFFI